MFNTCVFVFQETFLKFLCNAPGILGERLFFVFDSKKDDEIDYEEFLGGIAMYRYVTFMSSDYVGLPCVEMYVSILVFV